MSPNINTTAQSLNLLYKIISKTLTTNYRTSTPLLRLLTDSKRRGANKDGSEGFFDRFENNTMYLDFVGQPIFATASQPTAKFAFGQENILQFALPAVTVYNSVQYTEFVNQITTSDKGAVTKFASRIIRDMANGYKRSLNRMLWGTVTSAPVTNAGANALAVTEALGTATNTVVLSSLDANGDRTPTYYLAIGMPVEISGATGGTTIPGNVSATTITGINSVTNTVTISDTLTFSVSEPLYSISSDGSAVVETQGIQALVQDTNTTIQGVNMSQVPYGGFGHIFNNVGTFSLTTYSRAFNSCQFAKPTHEFMNQTVYDALAQQVLSYERTGMGTSSFLDIGYRSFTSHQGSVESVMDYDAPGGAIYGLYMPAYTLGILQDVSFLPMGTIRIPNYAAMEIAMQWVGQFGSSLIEPNYALTGITTV